MKGAHFSRNEEINWKIINERGLWIGLIKVQLTCLYFTHHYFTFHALIIDPDYAENETKQNQKYSREHINTVKPNFY